MSKTDAIGKKIGDAAFWGAMACELIVSPSGYLFGDYHEKLIILLGMFLFSLSLFFAMDIKKDWKAILLICAFGLLCFYFQRRALVLRIGLFLLSASRRDIRSMIKFFFYGSFAIIALGLVFSLTGTGNPLYLEELFRHETERRYTFGFFHPNGFSFFWIRQFIMFIYLYRDKLPLYGMLIADAVCAAPLVLSRSKIALAMYLMFAAADLILRIPALKDKAEDVIFYPGCVMLSAELLLIYTLGILPYPQVHIGDARNLWDYMNEVTSGRLWHARDQFLRQLPGVFGLSEVEDGTEIGFVNSLYNEGIVFILLFVVLLYFLLYKMRKAKDKCGMLLVLGFAFYALAESFLPYMNKNMIWIAAVAYLPLITGKETYIKKDEKE